MTVKLEAVDAEREACRCTIAWDATTQNNDVVWHVDRPTAEAAAQHDIKDAEEGGYHVVVYVLQLKKKGEV